nr:epoxide hydrolase 4-like [Ipomoea batatas]
MRPSSRTPRRSLAEGRNRSKALLRGGESYSDPSTDSIWASSGRRGCTGGWRLGVVLRRVLPPLVIQVWDPHRVHGVLVGNFPHRRRVGRDLMDDVDRFLRLGFGRQEIVYYYYRVTMFPSCLSPTSLYGGFLRVCLSAAGLTSQTIDIDDETTIHFWGPNPKPNSKSPPKAQLQITPKAHTSPHPRVRASRRVAVALTNRGFRTRLQRLRPEPGVLRPVHHQILGPVRGVPGEVHREAPGGEAGIGEVLRGGDELRWVCGVPYSENVGGEGGESGGRELRD